jgi:hypothetical protein
MQTLSMRSAAVAKSHAKVFFKAIQLSVWAALSKNVQERGGCAKKLQGIHAWLLFFAQACANFLLSSFHFIYWEIIAQ